MTNARVDVIDYFSSLFGVFRTIMMRNVLRLIPTWSRILLAVAAALVAMESRAMACSQHQSMAIGFWTPEASIGTSGRFHYTSSAIPMARSTSREHCGTCPWSKPSGPDRSPCRGPSCSDNPDPPGLPMSASQTNELRDPFGVCLLQPEVNAAPPFSWVHMDQSFRSVARTDSIFHPPRLS